jgi:mannan endo-1,4-beta-mannosidase
MKNIYRLILTSAFCALVIALFACPSAPDPINTPGFGARDLSPNTKRLMNYLTDTYGNYIISGQMDTAWTENGRMDMIKRVFDDTGKYPAIKGFDFIGLPQSASGFGKNQIDEAIEWWEGMNKNNGRLPAEKLLPDQPDIHGIVTFCWHWRVGAKQDFYTRNTADFIIPMKNGRLDTSNSNAAFQTIKSDLDKVAALLQLLKDRDIPVLWRPLHEASGGWFWWGATGPRPYKVLWEYMYNYLTNTKNLNNLIWVWNGQSYDWYPSPNTVDIVGFDYYTNADFASTAQNYSSQQRTFDMTLRMVPETNRMVALTENGAIPDPDLCKTANAMWLWFMTWNDAGNTVGATNKDNFWTGEYHNTQAHKTHVYNHALVITLDELPDLTAYRLE